MKRVESRRNHVVSKCSLDFYYYICFFNMILSLIPHLSLKLHRCMEQIWTAELSDILNIYDLYSEFCPTTRRNIPLLRLVSPRQSQPPRLPRRILGARGWTALQWAAHEGHAAVVELLISAGATVDAGDNGGRGPGRVFALFWEWL